jgi:hypothetical protein
VWDQSAQYWAILIAVNLPVFVGLGKLLFGGWSEFWECVTFWIQPDCLSALLGEWGKDVWAEFKLAAFLVGCAVIVLAEHFGMAALGWVGAG